MLPAFRFFAFWVVSIGLYLVRLGGAIVTVWSPAADRAWLRGVMRVWARASCRLFGLRVRVEGQVPPRPFFLVCNHLSYADIFVLAAVADCQFVAKSEVRAWPLIGLLARSAGTVFIDRARKRDLRRVIDVMDREWVLAPGIVVFAEGTSSAGEDVLPIKPGLLEFPAARGVPVWPATIQYRTDPRDPPAGEIVCWWGDATFAGHFLRFMRVRPFEAVLRIGACPVEGTDRKDLAGRVREAMRRDFQPTTPPSHVEDAIGAPAG
jgi:1-acyl-sn-glycerol-3-phosphate acyltransferase